MARTLTKDRGTVIPTSVAGLLQVPCPVSSCGMKVAIAQFDEHISKHTKEEAFTGALRVALDGRYSTYLDEVIANLSDEEKEAFGRWLTKHEHRRSC